MNWETLRSHDERIQRDMAAGNFRAALETLAQGYQHVMVGFCTNMLGDPDQAEEVAQEVFLAAYSAMPKYRQRASVRTWLFAIARKQCLKAFRNWRRRRDLQRERQDVIAEEVHRVPPPPPGEEIESRVVLVRNGLQRLDKAERALLLMRYDAGLPIADIAHILGISIASVRRRLGRALQHIREIIDG